MGSLHLRFYFSVFSVNSVAKNRVLKNYSNVSNKRKLVLASGFLIKFASSL